MGLGDSLEELLVFTAVGVLDHVYREFLVFSAALLLEEVIHHWSNDISIRKVIEAFPELVFSQDRSCIFAVLAVAASLFAVGSISLVRPVAVGSMSLVRPIAIGSMSLVLLVVIVGLADFSVEGTVVPAVIVSIVTIGFADFFVEG